MSRHIAPQRWADAAAGKLGDAERTAMTAHAASCRACAKTRERVMRSTATFATIRAQPAPEVAWDHVRARVHWSVSSERRAQERDARGRVHVRAWTPGWSRAATPWAIAAAAVAAMAIGTAPLQVASRHGHGAATMASVAPTTTAPSTAASVPRPVLPPAGLHGLVSRAAGEIWIDGARADDLFDRTLVAGSVLTTGEGRVDVQFGDASAFALGPHSRLELRRFDRGAIELAVDGQVDVEVAPRAAGQRFTVDAGAQEIEVRGTQFRVTHDAAGTAVACRHGLVAVRDRGAPVVGPAPAQVEVGAARHVAIRADHPVAGAIASAMSADEMTVLAQATPLTLPVWDDAGGSTSAPLEIVTPAARAIRVDGVEIGDAPLRVRVMPGRHLVDIADSSGRYRRAGWAEVAAPGTPDARPARLEAPIEAAPTAGVGARRSELLAGIDHARLARCVRSIAKAGLSGTYVQIELEVDASGAVGFLNVLDTDLPSATAACVREALADVRFGAGPAANWRERVDL